MVLEVVETCLSGCLYDVDCSSMDAGDLELLIFSGRLFGV